MRWTLHRIKIAEIIKDFNDEFSPVDIFNKARDDGYLISFKSVVDALEFLAKKNILGEKTIKLGSKEHKKYRKLVSNEKIDEVIKETHHKG